MSIRRTASLSVLLVAFMATSVVVSTSAVAAGLTLSTTVGHPATVVSVSGSGFEAGEVVDVFFDKAELAAAKVDASGAFSGVTIRIPRGARPGIHRISALGRTSAVSAQRRFVVRTDWLQFHFWANHAGLNPYENVLSRSNIGGVVVRWSRPAGGPVPYNVGTSPATLAHGLVYFGTWDTVYAVNASTGRLRWSFVAGTVVRTAPAISHGVVYAIGGGYLYALNALTGSVLWRSGIDRNVYSHPTVTKGVVYVGSTNTVYAMNASTGAQLWSFAAGGAVYSSPAIVDGVVYVGSQSADESLYALDAKSGAEIWHFPAGPYGIAATPAVVGGVVYVAAVSDTIYALDAATGTPRWSFATVGRVDDSPAVANGVVYVVSQRGNIYALNLKTGVRLWSYTANFGNVPSSPAVANGMLYVGADRFYAFGLPR